GRIVQRPQDAAGDHDAKEQRRDSEAFDERDNHSTAPRHRTLIPGPCAFAALSGFRAPPAWQRRAQQHGEVPPERGQGRPDGTEQGSARQAGVQVPRSGLAYAGGFGACRPLDSSTLGHLGRSALATIAVTGELVRRTARGLHRTAWSSVIPASWSNVARTRPDKQRPGTDFVSVRAWADQLIAT